MTSHAEYMRKWRSLHPNSNSEANRRWRKKHPKLLKERRSKWEKENRGKHLAHMSLAQAVRKGRIMKPSNCSTCGRHGTPRQIQGRESGGKR